MCSVLTNKCYYLLVVSFRVISMLSHVPETASYNEIRPVIFEFVSKQVPICPTQNINPSTGVTLLHTCWLVS